MAIIADIKWIKIATDIFDNRKIKLIKAMPEGDGILVTWFELLCMAGQCNDDGMVYITREIPYTEESLATVMNKPITTVRLALNTFEQFGMIEVVDNFLRLSNWEKYQNVDGMEKIRQRDREWHRKKRAEQKALLLAEKANVDRMSNDKSIDVDTQKKNQEEDLDKDIESSSYNPSSLKDDDDLYHLFDKYVWSMTPKIAEELKYLEGEYGTDRLRDAIKRTIDNGGHSVGYVKKCLATESKKTQGNTIADAFDALRGELNGEGNGA